MWLGAHAVGAARRCCSYSWMCLKTCGAGGGWGVGGARTHAHTAGGALRCVARTVERAALPPLRSAGPRGQRIALSCREGGGSGKAATGRQPAWAAQTERKGRAVGRRRAGGRGAPARSFACGWAPPPWRPRPCATGACRRPAPLPAAAAGGRLRATEQPRTARSVAGVSRGGGRAGCRVGRAVAVGEGGAGRTGGGGLRGRRLRHAVLVHGLRPALGALRATATYEGEGRHLLRSGATSACTNRVAALRSARGWERERAPPRTCGGAAGAAAAGGGGAGGALPGVGVHLRQRWHLMPP